MARGGEGRQGKAGEASGSDAGSRGGVISSRFGWHEGVRLSIRQACALGEAGRLVATGGDMHEAAKSSIEVAAPVDEGERTIDLSIPASREVVNIQ